MQTAQPVQAAELDAIEQPVMVEVPICPYREIIESISNMATAFGLAWGSYAIGDATVQAFQLYPASEIASLPVGLCCGIIALSGNCFCGWCVLPDMNQVFQLEVHNCAGFYLTLLQVGPLASLFGYLMANMGCWRRDGQWSPQFCAETLVLDLLQVLFGSMLGSFFLMFEIFLCFHLCAHCLPLCCSRATLDNWDAFINDSHLNSFHQRC